MLVARWVLLLQEFNFLVNVNFYFEYLNRNLYCMNGHHIVVFFLVVKVLVVLLVYTN
jgi:hypothetical protein